MGTSEKIIVRIVLLKASFPSVVSKSRISIKLLTKVPVVVEAIANEWKSIGLTQSELLSN